MSLSTRIVAGLFLAVAAIVLAVFLTNRRPAPPPPFALVSTAVTLPVDAGSFPPGPHVDAIAANCSACHSPSMILTQPPLTADQWRAEVKKMREVYKATVADEDVPLIVAYLVDRSRRVAAQPH